jgi:hypothetical protein
MNASDMDAMVIVSDIVSADNYRPLTIFDKTVGLKRKKRRVSRIQYGSRYQVRWRHEVLKNA